MRTEGKDETYELDRSLPLSLNGNIFITGEENEPKFHFVSNNNREQSDTILIG